MSNKRKTCPYPGLRPYNEEESIFFKGRDLHVRQITKQLEERKVVMITGASGDGKSSLVYAGLIPNARAGFFRAEYNNWKFVDFKPERDPLQTLAGSLATKLKLNPDETAEKLSYGFSSLIELYKSSDYFINEHSHEWEIARLDKRKQMRHKAANLFILADQFEEFFTNSENYSSGNPSTNAYTVVNLLLETAYIARRDNLPVYIIFTMRSDFISQCVAFKGLPELIGFSQFFVPRLKRNEIKQVIEDPALLSGGKISNRLTETLINELRDGFDQLPVLQHALHQLWKLADNGNEELDLIHLAKLAGMASKYLLEADKLEFEKWFNELPQYRREYFKTPELGNVLNTHANYLYESAHDYFNNVVSWAKKQLNGDDVKNILKITFQSLTKIDNGRAVRSRMTLREITQIINKDHIGYEEVCGVLNVFRLPDSTFVRPFINLEDLDTQFISANTVLDITHEALIRNWKLLREWENEEIRNLNGYREFEIQLHRWIDNEKSNQFLLPRGNLVHFEKWYEQCKPNPYWIVKYDESNKSKSEKLVVAKIIAEDITEYLKQSRNHLTQIEQAKKRRKNIALISAFCVIITLSVLMGFVNKEKNNAQRQKLIATEQSIEAKKQQQQAELERNNAIKANKRAEEERKRAEQNAQYALNAKAVSDEARKNEESMRKLAEQQSMIAKQETEKAQTEKQRADEQRVIAEAASDSAHALSMLANAQTLAFKSKQVYSDKQQNLIMALEAYKLNKEYGGYERDAAIFDGLLSALFINDYNNIVYSTRDKTVATAISANNEILIYTKDNVLITLDGKTFKQKDRVEYLGQEKANKAFILSKNIVVSFEDESTGVIDIAKKEVQIIEVESDYLRSAVLFGNYFITASLKNNVRVWDLTGQPGIAGYSMHLTNLVQRLVASDKLLFAGYKNGNIDQLDIHNKENQFIDSLNGRISAMVISQDGDYLVVGSSRGEVNIYNTESQISFVGSINKPDILIESVAISHDNKLLAIASSDKEIALYDMDNLNNKPIVIKNEEELPTVQSIEFNDNRQLIANYNINMIRVWETSNEAYAKIIETKLNADVSNEKIEQVLGSINRALKK